ncbi:MAG: sugar transferase [Anaerolineales bacterium]|nr:sugar transferase [Anaerolineales bacterium]
MRRFSVNFAVLSMLIDGLLVGLGLSLSETLVPLSLSRDSSNADLISRIPTWIYILFALTWVVILLLLSIYDGRRNLYVVDEFTVLTTGALLASVSLAGILFLTNQEFSRLVFSIFIALVYISQMIWRVIARLAFHLDKDNPNIRRVLIIGAGPVGYQLKEQIENRPYLNLVVTAFLDDDTSKQRSQPDVLGDVNAARQVVTEQHIDDVVIALPLRAFQRASELIAEIHSLPVKVWIIPDYFHLALHKARVEEFAGLPMLDLRAPALNEYQRLTKRIFDLLLCLPSLVVVLPVLGLIAVAIRLDSRGPVFFQQERVGENGVPFKMIKFRTMVANAEELRHLVEHQDEQGNFIHKHEHDPRVTRIGHFLRRSSLDELPQVINVIRGEMSLVGPRPELPYLVEKYEPWQHKRFAVPQGITGWWQVNGRSDKPMHLHTEDDLFYVQNYSLLLDIQILIKTLWVVLRGKGAY